MRLVATPTVDVTRPPPQGTAAGEGLCWAELETDELRGRLAEYLTMRPLVEPAADLGTLAVEARAGAAGPRELVDALLGAVTGHVSYLPGSTDVTTRAAQAWEVGSGVCQDLSHVLIGALRAAGVPARYVSGYLGPGWRAPRRARSPRASPTPGSRPGWAAGCRSTDEPRARPRGARGCRARSGLRGRRTAARRLHRRAR